MNILAELHCHTRFSDGWSSPDTCVRQAARRGLRVLAVTDHNTAEGALPFWQNPFRHGVLVVPGEEISTDRGHLLAFFVRETIPPGPFEGALASVRAQGALAFMAHPYHIPLGNRWRRRAVCQLQPSDWPRLEGIEVSNGHNRSPGDALALRLASGRHLASISGSDAHFPFEIGNACTELDLAEFTIEGVRDSLRSGRTRPRRKRFSAFSVYLAVAFMNKVTGRRYAWKENGSWHR